MFAWFGPFVVVVVLVMVALHVLAWNKRAQLNHQQGACCCLHQAKHSKAKQSCVAVLTFVWSFIFVCHVSSAMTSNNSNNNNNNNNSNSSGSDCCESGGGGRVFHHGTLSAEAEGGPAKPSIRLWGFSTRVASDDASVFFLIPLLVSAGFLATAVLLILSLANRACEQTPLTLGFACSWLALAALGLLVDLLQTACSCRGTIRNAAPRRKYVTALLATSIVLDLLQVCSQQCRDKWRQKARKEEEEKKRRRGGSWFN